MMELTTTTYLTKKQIRLIFNPDGNDIDYFILAMIQEGCLEKSFSYYKPTVKLLKDMKIIPNKIKIIAFNFLAKNSTFTLKQIMDIFRCNKDVARLIVNKYFSYKWPWYRKNETLNQKLEDGEEWLNI